jgi:multicomponent Na+:H+ antiporter subunit E
MARRSELVHFVVMTLALFVFWLILSGSLRPKHLIIGSATSVAVTLLTRPLLRFPWDYGRRKEWRLAWDLPWARLFFYLPWLLWQIVQANLQVAWLVLHPRLPIEPQVVRFKKRLPTPVAHVVLANSITLTPGTVTVDFEGDEYVVHALWSGAAASLVPAAGEGDIVRRVAWVFEQKG